LDDTLNNFTETLRATEFVCANSYNVTRDKFDEYIGRLKINIRDDDNELLSTEFSYFRYKILEQCHEMAKARADGVAFMQWLRANEWKIVICTSRDLRKANHATKDWLKKNNIPWDYLFTAQNKIVFCNVWGIKHLVDDDPFNIVHGERYGVNVYYPILESNKGIHQTKARGFNSFAEVKQWIQE
jgi:uncharacterized HAD superfamily protein